MKPTQLHISSATDKGLERGHNEDYHIFCSDLAHPEWSFFASQEIKKLGKKGSVFIIADGMGGTNAGEVASRIAIEECSKYLEEISKAKISSEGLGNFMEKAIRKANEAILSHQKTDPQTKGMGTTIVIGWILENELHVSWVGDSRCYRYNLKDGLSLLTKDHSYVQELVDKGTLTTEQAFFHPESNIITQSLGNEKKLPKPGFISYGLQKGDKLIFCTDGLNGMLQDAEIEAILSESKTQESCLKNLIDAANKAGGHDNITVILCDIKDVDEKRNIPLSGKKTNGRAKEWLKYFLFFMLGVVITGSVFYFFSNKNNIEVSPPENHYENSQYDPQENDTETIPDSTSKRPFETVRQRTRQQPVSQENGNTPVVQESDTNEIEYQDSDSPTPIVDETGVTEINEVEEASPQEEDQHEESQHEEGQHEEGSPETQEDQDKTR